VAEHAHRVLHRTTLLLFTSVKLMLPLSQGRTKSHHAYWLPGIQFSFRWEYNILSSCEKQSQKCGWLVSLLCILEVPVSNLSADTRHHV